MMIIIIKCISVPKVPSVHSTKYLIQANVLHLNLQPNQATQNSISNIVNYKQVSRLITVNYVFFFLYKKYLHTCRDRLRHGYSCVFSLLLEG